MTPQEKARQLRPFVEKGAASLSDADASCCVELLRGMRYDGALIEAGTRINWKGKGKIARADLWDAVQNDPEHAPNLWRDMNYRDGIRVIPETISWEEKFSKGELGWWGDKLCRSTVDNNVYTPAQYAANWEEV